MRSQKLAMIAATVVVMSLFSGCLWAPDLDRVREEIEEQLPGAHFEKEFAISLGPISLGFARMVVGLVPDAREARPYLKEIRSVKLAVYEADNMPDDIKLSVPGQLERLLERNGWEMAVKVRDSGETVWILYRGDEDSVRELYVVALDRHELVLVQASGRLDRLLDKAMADHLGPEEFGIRVD